jgi:hypothetical protein
VVYPVAAYAYQLLSCLWAVLLGDGAMCGMSETRALFATTLPKNHPGLTDRSYYSGGLASTSVRH